MDQAHQPPLLPHLPGVGSLPGALVLAAPVGVGRVEGYYQAGLRSRQRAG